MYQIDFKKPCKAYFTGIGGISMSGFAELLHKNGFDVYGSDIKESKITRHLSSSGLHIVYGQSASNITNDISFVVYTAAIHPENPELIAARELGIPVMERAELAGQVMKNYDNSIAVAGTHGKTTTTSMLSHIYLAANKNPTISVGGILAVINGNMRIGGKENFIIEACEYTNSFLKFHPTAGIILNIGADHLDFFSGIDDIRSSFRKFAELIPEDGILVVNNEIDNLSYITENLKCKVVTFGYGGAAGYSAGNISYDGNGCGSFDIIKSGINTGRHIKLNVTGSHNIGNALAVIAISDHYGIPEDAIEKGLFEFKGTERRFEIKGSFNGVTVIDDYAHHPDEIRATLNAASKYPHEHLWCVFQPHTYTRTRSLLSDFASALSLAENVILADIYAAREDDPGDISSQTLQHEIEKHGKKAYYFPSFKEIEDFLYRQCTSGDMVITMGAGDVVNIGEDLLEK